MGDFEKQKIDDSVLAERINVPHVTVYELMTTIYNYMSECYTSSDIRARATAVKVLTDEVAVELLAELEGLEP